MRNPSTKPALYARTSRAAPLRQDLILLRTQNFRSDLNGRTPDGVRGKYRISIQIMIDAQC